MPAIGSRTAAGFTPTSRMAAKVWSAASPTTDADDHDERGDRHGGDLQPEAGAGVDDLAQLDGDEAAEARARVDAGGVDGDRCGEGVVLMRGLLPARGGSNRSRRRSASAGRGQLEEEALEAGALGRGEPAQHDAAGHRRAGDDLGLGLDQPPIAVGGVQSPGRRCWSAASSAARSSASTIVPDSVSSSSRVPCAWIRPSPMIIIRSATASTSASRCEESSTVPPRSANAAQQPAHPAHALRIEAVGGLVEDQDLRVAEQRVGEPEALAHAERVLADPPPGRRLVEADELQQRRRRAAPARPSSARTRRAPRGRGARRAAPRRRAGSPTRRPGFGRSR